MKYFSMKKILGAVVALALILGAGFLLRPIGFLRQITYMRETLTGVESRSVQVGGYRMHYLAEGPANGPVVVLVHGLGANAEDWDNLAPYLVKAGFRVYIPDLIGYGRSDKPTTGFPYSVRSEAAAVVGFMDAVGLKQVTLGGWSMGGWIATFIAVEHPERVGRLMLFDAAGLYIKPTWNTELFVPQTPGQIEELQALLMPEPKPLPGFIARDYLRLMRSNGWVIHRAMDTMRYGQDTTDNMLARLKMPVLIEWGAADRIFPLDQAQTMHRLIPQSQLDIYEGCGHRAPAQCAEQMAPKVVAFARP
jgi:pimeloyl-ACP methyl ester carboxylesterase